MDYPSNSDRSKAKSEPIKPNREKVSETEEREEKKINQVTTGKVIRRKKPLRSRVADVFGTPDFNTVVEQIVVDVLVPSAKEMVEEAVGQGISNILWGEGRSPAARRGSRNHGAGRVNFTSFSSGNNSRNHREEPAPVARRKKQAAYEEIILATRVEAEDVIDRMYDLLQSYDVVSVHDLYELVGIVGSHQDQKWGWFDLKGLQARRITGGYLIDIPEPEFLD